MSDTAGAPSEFIETDRFTEIQNLKSGWYDGEGKAVSETALREGRRLRDILIAANIETCVFPTIEGGISIEDKADEFADSFTITIAPDGSVVVLSFDDDEVDEDHDHARTLPASSPWLTAFIKRNA